MKSRMNAALSQRPQRHSELFDRRAASEPIDRSDSTRAVANRSLLKQSLLLSVVPSFSRGGAPQAVAYAHPGYCRSSWRADLLDYSRCIRGNVGLTDHP